MKKYFLLSANIIAALLLMNTAMVSASADSATEKHNNKTDSNANSTQQDEGFTYKFGGKIQLRDDIYDGVFSNNGKQISDYYLRRAEAGVAGQLLTSLHYEVKLKADFEGKVTLRDAYLSYDLPSKSEILLGRFDPDFGLELSGSNSWVTAVERSSIWDLVKNAGDGSDGEGMAIRTAHKHYFLSLGGFDFSDSKVLNARAVYIPINKNKQVLHLGYSIRNADYNAPDDGSIHSDLSVWGVHVDDNGNSIRLARESRAYGFDSDLTQVLEIAYAQGPFSLQGEHLERHFNAAHHDHDRDATGDYFQIAYTLTGEARAYNIGNATFGKIKSNKSYGAWEIFYRWDSLSTDGEAGLLKHGRTQGEANSNILGVNWYALSYLKVSANYIEGHAPLIPNDIGDENGKAFLLQAQLRF